MKKILSLLCAGVLLFLSGCSDRPPELGERLIIEAIGVDKTETGFAVTVQTLNDLSVGADEGTPEGGATKCYTFYGTTVAEALASVGTQTGLSPLYSQTRLLALGYDTARYALCEALDFFLRGQNTRVDIPVAIAQNTAAAIVTADFGKNRVGADVLTDLLAAGEETGTALSVPLYRFMSLLLSETDAAYCPLLAVKENPPSGDSGAECIGTVLFYGTKFGTVISADDTVALRVLTDQLNSAALTVPVDGRTVTLRITGETTRIQPEPTAGGWRFRVRIAADCDVTEVTSADLTQLSPEEIRSIADAASRQMTESVAAVLQTCFYGSNCDVCRFFQRLRQRHPTRYRTLAEQNRLSSADFPCEIECRVSIRRTGKEVLKKK